MVCRTNPCIKLSRRLKLNYLYDPLCNPRSKSSGINDLTRISVWISKIPRETSMQISGYWQADGLLYNFIFMRIPPLITRTNGSISYYQDAY